jgi:hypothetical protein
MHRNAIKKSQKLNLKKKGGAWSEWKGAMEQPGLSEWPFASHLRRRPQKI